MTSLRQRMLEDMQVRNLSPHTQTLYVQQVSRFARYFEKSPECLGPEEIRAYEVYLTNERKLAVGSILVAVAALRFLYTVTLKKDWTLEDVIPAPKKPQRLPVVLSPGGSPPVSQLRAWLTRGVGFDRVSNRQLAYGDGVRLHSRVLHVRGLRFLRD